MFQRITTKDQLVNYLENIVEQETAFHAKYHKAREEGKLRHFMQFNNMHYQAAVVKAELARHDVEFLNGPATRDGKMLSDDEKLEIIKEMNMNYMTRQTFDFLNRSTSIAANCENDAVKEYNIHLFQALHGGY